MTRSDKGPKREFVVQYVSESCMIKTDKEPVYEHLKAQVKFYDREKGFGFIKRDNKPDIFISRKAMFKAGLNQLNENETVEFDLVPTEGKGGKAINIKKVVK